LIQEVGDKAKTIESKVDELASLPDIQLDGEEIKFMAEVGNNKGCMELKGANRAHVGSALPDRWEIIKDHELIAKQWQIDPDKDIACTHKAEKAA
jgi:hypothetical protein